MEPFEIGQLPGEGPNLMKGELFLPIEVLPIKTMSALTVTA